MTDEIWKDIETIPYHQAAWPFHQVSNKGRVRILPGGKIGRRLITQPELRNLTRTNTGYMIIFRQVSSPSGRRSQSCYAVHALVLNAFWGPCPPGEECRHLNNNPSDNRWPENIKWGTPEDNYLDKIRHGTDNRGERSSDAILTESAVIDIKSRLGAWGIVAQLAKEYDVSPAAIRAVLNGRNWKSVKIDYDIPKYPPMQHLIPDMEPIEYPQMALSFGG